MKVYPPIVSALEPSSRALEMPLDDTAGFDWLGLVVRGHRVVTARRIPGAISLPKLPSKFPTSCPNLAERTQTTEYNTKPLSLAELSSALDA